MFVGKADHKKPIEDEGVNARIILKYVINEYVMRTWSGFIWLGIGNSSWSR
jgi:hypothetical protein